MEKRGVVDGNTPPEAPAGAPGEKRASGEPGEGTAARLAAAAAAALAEKARRPGG